MIGGGPPPFPADHAAPGLLQNLRLEARDAIDKFEALLGIGKAHIRIYAYAHIGTDRGAAQPRP